MFHGVPPNEQFNLEVYYAGQLISSQIFSTFENYSSHIFSFNYTFTEIPDRAFNLYTQKVDTEEVKIPHTMPFWTNNKIFNVIPFKTKFNLADTLEFNVTYIAPAEGILWCSAEGYYLDSLNVKQIYSTVNTTQTVSIRSWTDLHGLFYKNGLKVRTDNIQYIKSGLYTITFLIKGKDKIEEFPVEIEIVNERPQLTTDKFEINTIGNQCIIEGVEITYNRPDTKLILYYQIENILGGAPIVLKSDITLTENTIKLDDKFAFPINISNPKISLWCKEDVRPIASKKFSISHQISASLTEYPTQIDYDRDKTMPIRGILNTYGVEMNVTITIYISGYGFIIPPEQFSNESGETEFTYTIDLTNIPVANEWKLYLHAKDNQNSEIKSQTVYTIDVFRTNVQIQNVNIVNNAIRAGETLNINLAITDDDPDSYNPYIEYYVDNQEHKIMNIESDQDKSQLSLNFPVDAFVPGLYKLFMFYVGYQIGKTKLYSFDFTIISTPPTISIETDYLLNEYRFLTSPTINIDSLAYSLNGKIEIYVIENDTPRKILEYTSDYTHHKFEYIHKHPLIEQKINLTFYVINEFNDKTFASNSIEYNVVQKPTLQTYTNSDWLLPKQTFTIIWNMEDVSPSDEITFEIILFDRTIQYSQKAHPKSDYTTDNFTFEGNSGDNYGSSFYEILAYAQNSEIDRVSHLITVNATPRFENVQCNTSLAAGDKLTIITDFEWNSFKEVYAHGEYALLNVKIKAEYPELNYRFDNSTLNKMKETITNGETIIPLYMYFDDITSVHSLTLYLCDSYIIYKSLTKTFRLSDRKLPSIELLSISKTSEIQMYQDEVSIDVKVKDEIQNENVKVFYIIGGSKFEIGSGQLSNGQKDFHCILDLFDDSSGPYLILAEDSQGCVSNLIPQYLTFEETHNEYLNIIEWKTSFDEGDPITIKYQLNNLPRRKEITISFMNHSSTNEIYNTKITTDESGNSNALEYQFGVLQNIDIFEVDLIIKIQSIIFENKLLTTGINDIPILTIITPPSGNYGMMSCIQFEANVKSKYKDIAVRVSIEGGETDIGGEIHLLEYDSNRTLYFQFYGVPEETDLTFQYYIQNRAGSVSQKYTATIHCVPHIANLIMIENWDFTESALSDVGITKFETISTVSAMILNPVEGMKLKVYYQLNNDEPIFIKEVISEAKIPEGMFGPGGGSGEDPYGPGGDPGEDPYGPGDEEYPEEMSDSRSANPLRKISSDEEGYPDDMSEIYQIETIQFNLPNIAQKTLVKIFFIDEEGSRSNTVMKTFNVIKQPEFRCTAVEEWDKSPVGFPGDLYTLSCQAVEYEIGKEIQVIVTSDYLETMQKSIVMKENYKSDVALFEFAAPDQRTFDISISAENNNLAMHCYVKMVPLIALNIEEEMDLSGEDRYIFKFRINSVEHYNVECNFREVLQRKEEFTISSVDIEFVYPFEDFEEHSGEFSISVTLFDLESEFRYNFEKSIKFIIEEPEPVDPTPDPENPTPDPENPTPDPENPTQNPEEPTQNPEEPTQNPEEPTQNPEEPTQNPEEPTQNPEEPTQNPEEPTKEPVHPTVEPLKPSSTSNVPSNDDSEDPSNNIENSASLFRKVLIWPLIILVIIGCAIAAFFVFKYLKSKRDTQNPDNVDNVDTIESLPPLDEKSINFESEDESTKSSGNIDEQAPQGDIWI
ncbi:hypothetical protein TVAG_056280 [Trichomonas vaginalis G3]|uniref:Uncharacterized protein n=1 Tax=Trichomonas vaginalis (strain ATCC PRA-98 / G3) TaxID=412133 RepID=A2ECI7_TRIV3|nr:hypothetical protein TVAGG3_0881640 [Trichomonas vaginalis G3]EAY09584.1 hypothetical protein TVAG_056280 [Trichomonas vaginalis G3]KAI5502095.1 hypothetical protein TVAGG3_0881640 [Trichomonas vaginalis G3]|eukprot:XP_001321807.1 hypothetical protein [Trichomonas vaginalis G3]